MRDNESGIECQGSAARDQACERRGATLKHVGTAYASPEWPSAVGESPAIVVLKNRFVASGNPDGAVVMPISRVLTARFNADAHFGQYRSASGTRVSKSNIGSTKISMVIVAFDVDGIDHQASDQWRTAEAEKITRLLAKHPGLFAYATRGGYRVVGRLPQPIEINSPEDAANWSARYLAGCDHLKSEFEIIADRLADFTRLFRAPHATRDPKMGPEDLPVIGAPEALGIFELPEPTTTTTTDPRSIKRGGDQSLGVSHSAPEPALYSSDDLGLFHRMLSARGHVLGAHDLGDGERPAFKVLCPNRHEHTSGTNTAILIAPNGSGPGWLKCWHAHCCDLEPHDWLERFTPAELEAAQIVIREVQIKMVAINELDSGVRIGVEIIEADNRGALPLRYLRISAGTRPWYELWKAAGVKPPIDRDPNGDLGGACDELRGRKLQIEIDGAAQRLRRIVVTESEAA